MKYRDKLIVLSVVTLVAGLILGPYIDDIPGFIVIVIHNTTYEMRLWLAVALLLLLIVMLFIGLKIIRLMLGSVGQVSRWSKKKSWSKARQRTIDGMIAFAEGNWANAEKLNISAIKHSDTKLLNYLVAAQSAQQLHESKRRDNYLALAQESQPNAKIAVYLTQAQLQVQEGQLEQAIATLSQLQSDTASRHKHVLKLLTNLYDELQDWKQLNLMLPLLHKQKVFDQSRLEQLECRCTIGLLDQAARQNDQEAIFNIWQAAHSNTQRNPDALCHYIKILIVLNMTDKAELLLRQAIKKKWNDKLVFMYSQAVGSDIAKQLATAEAWLKQKRNNPFLLITLGKLCLENKLWGKAQNYLEEALAIKPVSEAFVYLGEAKENLNEHEKAFECYKKGLHLAIKDHSQLSKQSLSLTTPEKSVVELPLANNF